MNEEDRSNTTRTDIPRGSIAMKPGIGLTDADGEPIIDGRGRLADSRYEVINDPVFKNMLDAWQHLYRKSQRPGADEEYDIARSYLTKAMTILYDSKECAYWFGEIMSGAHVI